MERSGGGANVGVSGTGRGFCGEGGFLRGTRVGIAFLGAELLARASRSGSENSVVVEGIEDDDSFAGIPYIVRLNSVNYGLRNIHTVSRACVTNRNSRSPYVSPGTDERGTGGRSSD